MHRLFLCGTFAALLLAACGDKPEDVATPPPALVVTAQSRNDAQSAIYSGEVRARHEVDLSFRIPGKLVARKVDVGTAVKAGDALAQIDPADVKLNADAARAQLAAAETDYSYAKSEMDRYDSLLEKKFISPAIHDAKRAQLVATKARLDQARSQAGVAGNQADYATLRADRTGIVTLVMAEPGQVVGAGQPVMKLAQPDEKEVVVAIPENRLNGLKPGAAATVRLWAAPDKDYRGKVREVAPNADPLTRTFTARITLAERAPEAHLGMTASVFFNREGPSVIALPLTAVLHKDGQNIVWIVDAGQPGADGALSVQPRAVSIGRYTSEIATVVDGLKPGERVVALGGQKLLPGMRVRPLETKAPANTETPAETPKATAR